MSNAAQPAQVLYDDPDTTAFTYGGGQEWTKVVLPQWYGQTTVYPFFSLANLNNATKVFGTLTCNFDGTAAAFVGNTPGAAWSQVATVSIDGGEPYNITYPGSPPTYIQWYKTPTLPPGNHTVSITNIEGTALDYAIIDLAPTTNLTGRAMVIDDSSPAIQYSGSWTKKIGLFDAGGLPPAFPFGNGSHSTSTVGDQATFAFSGSQLNVYGVFNWAQLGVLGVDYIIDDGEPVSQLYPVIPTSTGFQVGYNDQSNFLFFTSDSIQPGQHTLVINITRADNISFALDYITYTPNFETLEQMPNISLPILSSPSTTTSGPQATASGQTTVTGTSSPHSKHSSRTAMILGSVLGSILVIVLCSLAINFWRRYQMRRKRASHASQAAMYQEGGYPEMSDPWRRLDPPAVAPPLRQVFGRTGAIPTTSAYLNFGPNARPTKQGLHSPVPDPTHSRSDSNFYASSAPEEVQSLSTSPSDAAILPGTDPSHATTVGGDGPLAREDAPSIAPPAYASEPSTRLSFR